MSLLDGVTQEVLGSVRAAGEAGSQLDRTTCEFTRELAESLQTIDDAIREQGIPRSALDRASSNTKLSTAWSWRSDGGDVKVGSLCVGKVDPSKPLDVFASRERFKDGHPGYRSTTSMRLIGDAYLDTLFEKTGDPNVVTTAVRAALRAFGQELGAIGAARTKDASRIRKP